MDGARLVLTHPGGGKYLVPYRLEHDTNDLLTLVILEAKPVFPHKIPKA